MTVPAIVLAGERPGGNALARAFDLPSSVLVEVAGHACIIRAIAALVDSQTVSGGVICGPDPATRATSPVMRSVLENTSFSWLPPEGGPAESALAALNALAAAPVLLTAADHALLTPEIVDNFVNLALLHEADFVVGFVPYSIVRRAFPESKRTVLKFADRQYCGSNLFMIRTPRGAELLRFWQDIQQHRKRPWRMAKAIGIGTLLSYLTGRLTIARALQEISDRCGCRVGHVEVLNPRAAVDVDSLADHALAEQVLSSEC
ncbi:MAG TPA: NTP transferase domain-containing protein [Pseudomonadales bacterium]